MPRARFNVKGLRESLGLSIDAISKRAGVTSRTWSRWENGHVDPSPLALAKLRELQAHTRPSESSSPSSSSSSSVSQHPMDTPRRRDVEFPIGGGIIPSRRLTI